MTSLDALVIEPLGKRHDRAAFSLWAPRIGPLPCAAGWPGCSTPYRQGVCLHRRGCRYRPGLLHAERPVDRPEFSTRRAIPKTTPASGALRPYRSACCRPVSTGARFGSHASRRCNQATMRASDIMAIHAAIVDAKNNAAKQFYEGFGFAPMQDDAMRLFYRLARSAFRILLQTAGQTAGRGPEQEAAPDADELKGGT